MEVCGVEIQIIRKISVLVWLWRVESSSFSSIDLPKLKTMQGLADGCFDNVEYFELESKSFYIFTN